MNIQVKMSFDEIYEYLNEAGKQTMKIIRYENEQVEFMQMLDDLFGDNILTASQLNDFIAYSDDDIFGNLNIDENNYYDSF